MRYKLLRKNRFLGLMFFVVVMVAAIMAFAATRRVTLTTYYPAPYGKYNDLQSKTLTVSDKVGIGTTNPQSRVHIKLGEGEGPLALQGDTPNTGVDLQWYDSNATFGPPSWSGTYAWDLTYRTGGLSNPPDSLMLYKSDTLPMMTWTQAGNVGIGTTSPYGGVHIRKSGQSLNLQTENNSQTFDIQFYDADDTSGNYKWDLTYRGNLIGDDLMLYRNAGTPVMTWQNSSGNVGIGTTSPGSRLQIGTPGMNGREYMQVDMESSTPPPGDCDSQPEGGRMIYDDLTKRLYICDGQDGWRYSNTTK